MRPLEERDIEPWSEFFTHLPNPEWIDVRDTSRPERLARVWIERQFKRYANKEYGILAVTMPETDELAGICGLVTHIVEGEEVLEIGYHLIHRFRGKGYAIEAARYFKEFGFRHQLAPSITSFMHVDNWPSRQVAIRNGMEYERDFTFKGLPCAIYRVWAPGPKKID